MVKEDDLSLKERKEVKKEIKQALSVRLASKAQTIKSEFRKQTSTAIIAAFGLVIALSWQTVIKEIVDTIPKTGILLYHPYLADLYTALIVTAIAVIGILAISFWAKRGEKSSN